MLKIILSLTLILSLFGQAQAKSKVDPKSVKADPKQIKQDITAQLAMDAIVDYWKKTMTDEAAKPEHDPQKAYDIKSAQITRKKMKDCDHKMTEKILVVFKSTKDTSHAYALFKSEQDMASKKHEHIGFSNETAEDLVSNVMASDCHQP